MVPMQLTVLVDSIGLLFSSAVFFISANVI